MKVGETTLLVTATLTVVEGSGETHTYTHAHTTHRHRYTHTQILVAQLLKDSWCMYAWEMHLRSLQPVFCM